MEESDFSSVHSNVGFYHSTNPTQTPHSGSSLGQVNMHVFNIPASEEHAELERELSVHRHRAAYIINYAV